ncbi:hypothetical protein ECP02989422_4984 [Escherichia coli P0298942.2]|nr:hypothetical protein ECP02989426_3284 [Escherichia coli P0298942.6]ENB71049.1 hypothetical protein ECP02989422_4984 [Escherichia coli P0298942.2]END65076.1 hypothetical protein ECP02989423_3472 [Escherichia coli P0298942.3]ENG83375.1 hypothetical protein ECP029894212_3292 [Escherichia coli P0298942.12]
MLTGSIAASPCRRGGGETTVAEAGACRLIPSKKGAASLPPWSAITVSSALTLAENRSHTGK